jgi:Flp pilus assembly CpaF family ATPase
MSTKKLQKALGPIAKLFEDPQVMEITIDGTQRVTVEKRGKIEDSGLRFKTNDEVKAIIEETLKSVGVEIEDGKTVYEVRLTDNSRMIAILAPTAIDGHCVTFRKWATNQITWEKLFEYNAATPEMRDLIQSAINSRVGILIAGVTGSVKTTVANRVAELIPADERVIVVEDSHQYQIEHPRAIFLEAKGTPNMTMNDVIIAGSKMRPDWLVVGELEGAESMRAMQTFSVGYSGITTMHATSAENALTRLETMCLMANLGLGMEDIRQIIVSGLRLIAYQERLPNGQRKVTQIVELKGLEDGRYILQPLMRYNPETDEFESTGVKASW